MGKNSLLDKHCLEKLYIHKKCTECDPYFYSLYKSNFKGIKDLSIRPKSPQTPRRKKHKEKLLKASLGNGYFEETYDIMSIVNRSRSEEIS